MFYIRKIIKKGSYLYALVPDHPNANKNGYVLLHRVVMENYIGRNLKDNEVVHHINHNRYDCRLENLELMTKEEHTELHKNEKEGLYVLAKCPECGKFFLRRFWKNFEKNRNTLKIFCSHSCRAKYYKKEKSENYNSIITTGYATKKEVDVMTKTSNFNLLKKNKNEFESKNEEIKVDEYILRDIKPEENKNTMICKICGSPLKYSDGTLCIDCYNKQRKEILENKILENKERIYEMACEGKTVKQIAESLGLIPQSFSRACRRLNITYRV